MRNTTFLVLSLLAAGCEHKRGTDKPPPTGVAAREPAPDPAPGARKTITPAGGDGDVRAPVAADLETYTKDIPGQGKLMATFETPLGNITCELFPDKAPATVANFVGLATGKKPWLNPKTSNIEKGVPYFDNLFFHRVIQGFMLQGGDPLGQGTGGPGYKFEDELSPEMEMGPGTLAMANAGPVTNGSQFFIMDNASRPDLAKKHSIFGMCKELDVIAKISATPTGPRDKPMTPVTMKIKITKG